MLVLTGMMTMMMMMMFAMVDGYYNDVGGAGYDDDFDDRSNVDGDVGSDDDGHEYNERGDGDDNSDNNSRQVVCYYSRFLKMHF